MKIIQIKVEECLKYQYLDNDDYKLFKNKRNLVCFGILPEKSDDIDDLDDVEDGLENVIDDDAKLAGLLVIKENVAKGCASIVYLNIIDEYRDYICGQMLFDKAFKYLKNKNTDTLIFEVYDDEKFHNFEESRETINDYLFGLGFMESDISNYELRYYLSDIEDTDIYQNISNSEKYMSSVVKLEDDDLVYKHFKKKLIAETGNINLNFADTDTSRFLINKDKVYSALMARNIENEYIYIIDYYSNDGKLSLFPLLLTKIVSDMSEQMKDDAMLLMKVDNNKYAEIFISQYGEPEVIREKNLLFIYF